MSRPRDRQPERRDGYVERGAPQLRAAMMPWPTVSVTRYVATCHRLAADSAAADQRHLRFGEVRRHRGGRLPLRDGVARGRRYGGAHDLGQVCVVDRPWLGALARRRDSARKLSVALLRRLRADAASSEARVHLFGCRLARRIAVVVAVGHAPHCTRFGLRLSSASSARTARRLASQNPVGRFSAPRVFHW